MTVYYVNPFTGSNANSGLSWPNAWRHLPGDGTAIMPGDEVRYAKSPLRTTTLGNSTLGTTVPSEGFGGRIGLPSSTNGSTTTYGYRAVPNSLTATDASVSAAAGVLTFAAGATVPAGTKLAYVTWSFTLTSVFGAMIGTKQRGLPSAAAGTYLKIVLCSDTLGDTPILTLDGPTLFARNDGTDVWDARAVFQALSETTANYTVGSAAVYSIASFVVDSAPAITTFQMYGGMVMPPPPSNVNHIPIGAGIVRNLPNLASAPAVLPVPSVYTMFALAGNASHFTSLPAGTRGFSYGSWMNLSALTYYDPINYSDPSMLTPTALTFSGSLGNPVKIRGGFDPATDIQDGYTNIGFSLGYTAEQLAFLVFSSGGDYLELEHFVGGCTPLLGYTSGTPLASLRFTRCCLPGSPEGMPGPVAVESATFSIDDLVFQECQVNALHLVARTRQVTLASLASVSLTVDTLSFTDCWLCYLVNQQMPLHIDTSFTITGTAADTSLLIAQVGTDCHLTFSPGATFSINQAVVLGRQGFVEDGSPEALCSAADLRPDYPLSGVSVGSGTTMVQSGLAGIAFAGFLNPGISDVVTTSPITLSISITGPSGTSGEIAALFAAHDYTFSITGTMSVPTNGFMTVLLTLINSPGLVSFTSPAHVKPCVEFFSCNGELENMSFGYVQTYFPEDYFDKFPEAQRLGVEIRGCELFMVAAEGPQDLVKLYDSDLLYASTTPAGYPSSVVSKGALLCNFIGYACTLVPMDSQGYNPGPASIVQDSPGALLYGTKGTWRPYYQDTADRRWPTIHCSEDITFELGQVSVSDGTLDVRATSACFVRTPDKFFFAQGRCLAYSSASVNEYGQHDIDIRGRFKIAKLHVSAGQLYEITCTVRSVGTACVFKLMVLPGLAMATDIHQHVLHRYLATPGVDEHFSFSFTPEADGLIDVAVYGSSPGTSGSAGPFLRLRRFLLT